MAKVMQGELSDAGRFTDLTPMVCGGVAIEVRSTCAEQPLFFPEDASGYDMSRKDLHKFVSDVNGPLRTMLRWWHNFGCRFCAALDLPGHTNGAAEEVHICQL
jgi:hypothetical protein